MTMQTMFASYVNNNEESLILANAYLLGFLGLGFTSDNNPDQNIYKSLSHVTGEADRGPAGIN